MRDVFKTMIWILIIAAILYILARLSHYDERMDQINRYQCAVYGYEEDCKTPLPPERRLK